MKISGEAHTEFRIVCNKCTGTGCRTGVSKFTIRQQLARYLLFSECKLPEQIKILSDGSIECLVFAPSSRLTPEELSMRRAEKRKLAAKKAGQLNLFG